jgi:hypothetical protein
MRKTVRAGLGVLVAATATLGPAMAGSSVAQAALRCNHVFTFSTPGGYGLQMPGVYPSWTPYNCELVRGDRDSTGAPWAESAVHQLQNTLDVCYGKNLSVDGDYGPKTEQAVREVLGQVGTTPDGRYGPRTRAAMKHQTDSGHGCHYVWE